MFISDSETTTQPPFFFSKKSNAPLQTKLTIGQPGDVYEKEADAMAEKVVSSSAPALQAKCAECEKEEGIQKQSLSEEEELRMQPLEEKEEMLQTQLMEEEEDLQMKPSLQLKDDASSAGRTEASPWIQSRINSSRGSGRPLDSNTRSFMESRIQTDFGSVNIHTGDEAVQMNRELGARAFTVGSDIYFNSGEYRPETTEGKKLLAHELTHTVQQGQSIAPKIQRLGDLSKVPPMECDVANTSPAGFNALTSLFSTSHSDLSPDQRNDIAIFVANWRASGGTDILRVDGYASTPGSDEFNWKLSCERALSVGNELIIKGVPNNLIEIFAQGETTEFGAQGNNQRADITMIAAPPSPSPQPEPKNSEEDQPKCGPDMTSNLSTVVATVAPFFSGLTTFQKWRSCMGLLPGGPFVGVNPIMAWDIRELFLPNTGILDPYFSRYGCGSPRNPLCSTDPTRRACETPDTTCGNSVLVGEKCMLAGTANYALWGKLCRLCSNEFNHSPITYNIYFTRTGLQLLIRAWKAIDRDDPNPPIAMALSVYDGTFPTVGGAAENRSHCTGRCPQSYAGSLSFIWEPYQTR